MQNSFLCRIDTIIPSHLIYLDIDYCQVEKESETLNQEIQALERKFIVNATGHINEVIQLYEQNSTH